MNRGRAAVAVAVVAVAGMSGLLAVDAPPDEPLPAHLEVLDVPEGPVPPEVVRARAATARDVVVGGLAVRVPGMWGLIDPDHRTGCQAVADRALAAELLDDQPVRLIAVLGSDEDVEDDDADAVGAVLADLAVDGRSYRDEFSARLLDNRAARCPEDPAASGS